MSSLGIKSWQPEGEKKMRPIDTKKKKIWLENRSPRGNSTLVHIDLAHYS